MNNPADPHDNPLAHASREEIMAALFANMVIQQTNMAMMLLGKAPHPETGQFMQDLEAAKMFIDQLEMIEAKTKGNLSKQEEGLLKQALAALHMTFVEAVDGSGKPAAPGAEEPAASTTAPATEAKPQATPPAAEAPAAAEESRKKFSKKY
jgi:uncharacterized protein DUF1844